MSDLVLLAQEIKVWARALGFAELRITDIDLSNAEAGLLAWLAAGYHGEMDYMAKHGLTRARPAELVPGSVRVLSVRMNYLPKEIDENWSKRELKRGEEPDSAII